MSGDKKAAIEMSIGTIVTIVLAMTMLIGGIALVRNIIGGAQNVANLNNEQIASEIAKLYGEDRELVIYPNVDILRVEPGKETGFAIRIKNLLTGADSSSVKFSYDITFDSFDGCGFGEKEAATWFKGRSGNDIGIAPRGDSIQKILVTVPSGTALCSFRAIVQAKQDGKSYANEQIFISIK